MVKLNEAGPEQTTIAYAYGNQGTVVVKFAKSTADEVLQLVAEGRIGGKIISQEVKLKLENMIENLRHSPSWAGMPLRMAVCVKRSGGRRGH